MLLTEDIKQIEEQGDDERRGRQALTMWAQSHGKFDLRLLLDGLGEIRRKDIVDLVNRHVCRDD